MLFSDKKAHDVWHVYASDRNEDVRIKIKFCPGSYYSEKIFSECFTLDEAEQFVTILNKAIEDAKVRRKLPREDIDE